MANLHEIKAHIASVQSTKKITRAMYLISASKSQKAKTQLANSSPYFERITETMARILADADELNTPYIRHPQDFEEPMKKPDRDLYLVLGADKGMAGGYNHNLLEMLEEHCNKEVDELWVAGALSRARLAQMRYRVDTTFARPVADPTLITAREVADMIIEIYLTGRYENIYLLFTEMVSSVKQIPMFLRLLPLDPEPFHHKAPAEDDVRDFTYDPNCHHVFNRLVPHYLRGVLYSACVEAFSSEQSARMLAMDGATKSAGEAIDRLSTEYNRARQARITQELTEIVAGIPQE